MRTTEIAARAWGFLDKSQKGVWLFVDRQYANRKKPWVLWSDFKGLKTCCPWNRSQRRQYCSMWNVFVLYSYIIKITRISNYRESLVDGKKGQVLQNFLVATDGILLSPAENVALVQCVERETLSLAKRNGFQSIFTSNSSPLTQVIRYFHL